MVRVEGLEPPRLAAPEPKSGASTNFATPALQFAYRVLTKRIIRFRVQKCIFFKLFFTLNFREIINLFFAYFLIKGIKI